MKSAAEKVGRDPDSVRVWSCFATVGDHLPEQLRLKKTVARLATYLQGYGDLLVQTNNWDPAVLQRFRADSVVMSIAGGIDHKATPEQIEHIATLIPDEWLEPSATGSASECVARIRKEFEYGLMRRSCTAPRPTNSSPSSRRTERPDRKRYVAVLEGQGHYRDRRGERLRQADFEKCAAGGAEVLGWTSASKA